MIIRSKTPLRISFAGGGTEIEPYLSERGGAVLSSTIDKYAYSSLRFKDDYQITVSSLDYDIVAKYDADTRLIEDEPGRSGYPPTEPGGWWAGTRYIFAQ